jgi:beta-galactosidase
MRTRITLLLLLTLLALVPATRAATAVAVDGESRQSLDGPWRFTIDPKKPTDDWDTIAVPGNWDTINEYAHHVGKGWYRRTFVVPLDWKSKRIRLHFDAVYDIAEVTLNGTVVGTHNGGYTPFEFDITDKVKWDAPNELTVSADNTPRRGAWWHWGGISRDVELVANNDLRIVSQQIRAEPDLNAGTAQVFVRLTVENSSATAADTELSNAIDDRDVAALAGKLAVPPHSTATAEFSTSLPKDAVRLWDFDHPNLYRLTTRLAAGGVAVHSRRDRFGIRKIEVTKDGLLLNGERIRVNGFNRVSDHRAFGNTEPLHLVKLDVDLMRRYGGYMMRIMHTPQAPDLLNYMDEQGMLVFEEVPVWGSGDPEMKPGNPLVHQWLSEMIGRDYNHPCIIGWSVGNELLQHYEYVKSMIDFTRSNLDSHRLLAYISLSGARKEYGPKNDPISVSDMLLHNSYGPNPGKMAETLHAKWPDRPIFFSEFGAGMFGETLGSTIGGFEARWKDLANHPYVIGTSLWTFNDYRSDFKGSSPSELRAWGIVDLWRQPKAAARQIDKAYGPVHELSFADGTIRLVPRSPDEIPSFSLRGYYLKWEWLRRDGIVAGGGVMALPTLAPGSEPIVIPAGAPPASAEGRLVASLITPTGHIVAEYNQASSPIPLVKPPTTPTSPPTITRVYPVDSGFFVAYIMRKEDKTFTVEYGTQMGQYDHKLSADMPGAMQVRGLINGQTYYARLRRQAPTDEGQWSEEFAVTPDGGQKPRAPELYGAVRGTGIAALRFETIDKAIGYTIRCGNRTIDVPTAAVGTAVVTGLADAQPYTFTVTAINANGESPQSNQITLPAAAK